MNLNKQGANETSTLIDSHFENVRAERPLTTTRVTVADIWKVVKLKTHSRLFMIVVVMLLIWNVQAQDQRVTGTLVVAVPVTDGLVACSDKRAFNHDTRTFNDDLVKIHKVNSRALFVATNTVGFLDPQTGKVVFDVFEITSRYLARRGFAPDRQFWDALKMELRTNLLGYLSQQKFKDQPETDLANNRLLFNLIFYSLSQNTVRSYSLKVFYEKAKTPIVFIPDVVSEEVKTPKLGGKGKDVMEYLSRNPDLVRDPSIFRFDQRTFDIQKTTAADAVRFATKLFVLTNTGVPQANVSAAHDCALLSYQNGFQWIDDSGNPIIR
jgi:hypothetical protein